jgi:hypothetical protein
VGSASRIISSFWSAVGMAIALALQDPESV